MTYQEEVDKTVKFIDDNLFKHRFYPEEIHFCKTINVDRVKKKKEWNNIHPDRPAKESKISQWHSDEDLYFGALCELLVAKVFGQFIKSDNIKQEWIDDQIRQNSQLKMFGHYDCKDIGRTQVRAAEYSTTEKRNIIYRAGDFRSKVGQPLVGCVINTDEKDLWAVICGFMSYDDLVARKDEFWRDPDGRGYPAMFIPIWKLTPMNFFDVEYLRNK
jgi:hypothetical protein